MAQKKREEDANVMKERCRKKKNATEKKMAEKVL